VVDFANIAATSQSTCK